MENNKKTLRDNIRLQFGLIQLALITERQEFVDIAVDKLEELIKLIPEDIDSNGRKIEKFDDVYRWNGSRYVRRYSLVSQ
jgi:hypothetical protein